MRSGRSPPDDATDERTTRDGRREESRSFILRPAVLTPADPHGPEGMTGTAPDFEQLTSLFKLLSDGTRLNVLMLLAGGERNVTNLCEALGLPQPTVSHHLGLLRMNGVISNRRAGKQVFYSLNGRVDPAADRLQIRVDEFTVTIATGAGGATRIDGSGGLDGTGKLDGRAGLDGRGAIDGRARRDFGVILEGQSAD